MREPDATLALLDYRRRVGEVYTDVRREDTPSAAWNLWRSARNELFAGHPQSPLDRDRRDTFHGLSYFPYDPAWRLHADVVEHDAIETDMDHNGVGQTAFRSFGWASFVLPGGAEGRLALYWLVGYGGGVFLPFRDATNGSATYGGGRYLLDTAKGADLGSLGETLILDFNFAYHPSCVYSDRWSCPLAPGENRLDVAVTVGERLTDE